MARHSKESDLKPEEIILRKNIARDLIDSDITLEQEYLRPSAGGYSAADKRTVIPEPSWPDQSLAPQLMAINPQPQPDNTLPNSDWVVITWTKAGNEALRRVFTRTVTINNWYPYKHNFDSYLPDIRHGAPAVRLIALVVIIL